MANSEVRRQNANQPGEQPRPADEQARKILDTIPQKIVSAPADGVRHGVLEADYAFLQKPFTPTALAQKVRDVLGRKR